MKTVRSNLYSAHTAIKILAMLLLTTTSAKAQLTGDVREGFLQSYFNNCYDIQRSASKNEAIRDEVLKKYCRCLGINVANTSNNGILREILEGNINVDVILRASKLAERYCIKNYQSY